MSSDLLGVSATFTSVGNVFNIAVTATTNKPMGRHVVHLEKFTNPKTIIPDSIIAH